MSLHRQFVSAFLWSSVAVLSSTAHAQHGIIQGGILGTHHGEVSDEDVEAFYDPLCDIESDWFVPIYCDCPDERPINSGWFFSYDRVNLNVSRPRESPQQLAFDPGTQDSSILLSQFRGRPPGTYEGDWTWGNRFDFGYLTPEGTGLWIVARKQDNPSVRKFDDNIDLNDDDFLRLDNEPVGPTFVTLNGFNMWGVEVNKIWRLPPTPRGAVVEPFLGPRYIRIRDHSDRNDVYTDTLLSFPTVGIPGETRIERFDFNYQMNQVTTDNDLFGGQLGLRSRWRRGRWQIVSDLRGMMYLNFQTREWIQMNEIQQRDVTATYVDDGLGGGIIDTITLEDPVAQYQDTEIFYEDTYNLVYGGELRLEASFEVTRGFALRAGLEIMAFGDGIGRGLFANDESLVMAGWSMGFSLNR